MKTMLLAVAGAAALLAGCATPTPQPDNVLQSDNVDYRKVAVIDQIARTRGVTVKWLNYPQKRAGVTGT